MRYDFQFELKKWHIAFALRLAVGILCWWSFIGNLKAGHADVIDYCNGVFGLILVFLAIRLFWKYGSRS